VYPEVPDQPLHGEVPQEAVTAQQLLRVERHPEALVGGQALGLGRDGRCASMRVCLCARVRVYCATGTYVSSSTIAKRGTQNRTRGVLAGKTC
jgi:hypothetical protein